MSDSAFLTRAEVERITLKRRYAVASKEQLFALGKVYVLHDRAVSAYKIGFTTRTAGRRAREMRTGHPGKLAIEWQGAGTMIDEGRIHQLLKPSRLSGEWFAETGVVRIAIGLLKAYGAGFVADLELNQLQYFVPFSGSGFNVPSFHRIQPLKDWGSGGYWPEWSTTPEELRV